MRPRTDPIVLVFRVALNRALTHRTRCPPRAEPLDAASGTVDAGRTREDHATAAEQRERLFAALQSLPPRCARSSQLSLEGLVPGLSRARRMLQEAMNRT